MENLFFTVGLFCVVAAIVGGSFKAAGHEFPVIESVKRQIILAIFGALLIGAGLYEHSKNESQQPPGINPADGNPLEAPNIEEGTQESLEDTSSNEEVENTLPGSSDQLRVDDSNGAEDPEDHSVQQVGAVYEGCAWSIYNGNSSVLSRRDLGGHLASEYSRVLNTISQQEPDAIFVVTDDHRRPGGSESLILSKTRACGGLNDGILAEVDRHWIGGSSHREYYGTMPVVDDFASALDREISERIVELNAEGVTASALEVQCSISWPTRRSFTQSEFKYRCSPWYITFYR